MKNLHEYKNIPEVALEVVKSEKRNYKAIVNLSQNFSIRFNAFCLFQFMLGYRLLETDPLKSQLDLYHKIVDALLVTIHSEAREIYEPNHVTDLELSRDELQMLIKFLLARMKHCEKERDERSEKFSPDTYIAQKLLLIELKEIMLGEIVEVIGPMVPHHEAWCDCFYWGY